MLWAGGAWKKKQLSQYEFLLTHWLGLDSVDGILRKGGIQISTHIHIYGWILS